VLARLTGKSGGVDDLRIAEYPGPLGIHDADTIAGNIAAVLVDQVVAGLTTGTTHARSPAGTGDAERIVFSGTFDAINAHFRARDWSDGLPIVPPTPQRVEQFLRCAAVAPDQEIAVLPSANLRATARNIAANAVMAGCVPAHMPILIAAARALGDERCSLNNLGSSSGIIPFVLVNGPIARQLGIHAGGQLVSRYPNTAIGRAIGLIVRNIAGFRPGASYMGTFGYPLAFALAEPDDSPWPAFHAECGFAVDASAVTIGVTTVIVAAFSLVSGLAHSRTPTDEALRSGARSAAPAFVRPSGCVTTSRTIGRTGSTPSSSSSIDPNPSCITSG